jgi:hypothetical protein
MDNTQIPLQLILRRAVRHGPVMKPRPTPRLLVGPAINPQPGEHGCFHLRKPG